MIRLNVFIQVPEAAKAAFEAAAGELVAASQKEQGCIAYDLFQSATRSDVYMICETWSSEEALKAHEQTPHFTTLLPRIQELAAVKLEKFDF